MNENAQDDVIAVLTHDHREVQALFDELDQTRETAGPKQRKELVDRTTIRIVRHSSVAEQFLYPTVRHSVDTGAELADRENREHAQIEQTLKELAEMRPDDEPFEATLRHLMELVNLHIVHEERTVFPRLQSVCTADDLLAMGRMMTAG
ncbi:hemerythrin domain-containing protein [Catenulispora sp. NF23]|uniref:Hemerythrin domain-containing protein n=1 Tax=Catenulispora pinistramenti TaxID=2705254 RepID=A0ABS5KND0_9ACTN|nr:hemerythrin domain-containing protein [Catenulispora pinistramenti]MBS2532833.1 hemerythrin domain-containing protein [Catenulispora pinistramenti]MBS2547510.1 hemerythrin domain-containing protein [Catenulispora pinistramenti]